MKNQQQYSARCTGNCRTCTLEECVRRAAPAPDLQEAGPNGVHRHGMAPAGRAYGRPDHPRRRQHREDGMTTACGCRGGQCHGMHGKGQAMEASHEQREGRVHFGHKG